MKMPMKKYQIFISSTYEDLKEARRKVFHTILSMGHIPVAMEYFGAADDSSWDIIRSTIDASDYYVLIIGHRYGATVDDGKGNTISYTQREFNYAKERGLPIYCFILDDNVPVLPSIIEDDSMRQKLREFKADAKCGRNVVWWSNDNELTSLISTALYKGFASRPQAGWYRKEYDPKLLFWEDYYRCLNKLVQEVKQSESLGGFDFDIAVGISRGGMSAADLFSREFGQNKPVVSLFGYRDGKNTYFDCADSPLPNQYVLELLARSSFKKILLVDSLTRNGKCIFAAREYLKNNLPDKTIKTMVVYADEHLSSRKNKKIDYVGEYCALSGRKLSLV